jgi:uncharacterized membrane protein
MKLIQTSLIASLAIALVGSVAAEDARKDTPKRHRGAERTEAQKAEHKAAWDALSEEEKAEIKAKMAELREKWEKMTPEDRKAKMEDRKAKMKAFIAEFDTKDPKDGKLDEEERAAMMNSDKFKEMMGSMGGMMRRHGGGRGHGPKK